MIHACAYQTPVGPLTVLADHSDEKAPVIVAAGFCSTPELWDRLPATSTTSEGPESTDAAKTSPVEVDDLGPLQKPIVDYLAGDLNAIDRLPLIQNGTDLQQEVWDGLRAIPAGETRTYGELAGSTSKPNAVRAVGSACGKNLIAPFVPCHRALRSDGSLGGYLYGLDVKKWLLDHETVAA